MEGGYAFVDHKLHDLMWICEAFVTLDVEYVIVHDHAPSRKTKIKGNQINVDTGVVYGGPLTAVVLSEAERMFLQV